MKPLPLPKWLNEVPIDDRAKMRSAWLSTYQGQMWVLHHHLYALVSQIPFVRRMVIRLAVWMKED
jgi:hypothetical protein